MKIRNVPEIVYEGEVDCEQGATAEVTGYETDNEIQVKLGGFFSNRVYGIASTKDLVPECSEYVVDKNCELYCMNRCMISGRERK